MIQIRNGMFETNSSSTHVLVIMKTSDFNKFNVDQDDCDINELLFWNYTDSGETTSEQKFKTGEQLINEMIDVGEIESNDEAELSDVLRYANNQGYYTYDQVIDMTNDYEYVTDGDVTALSLIIDD